MAHVYYGITALARFDVRRWSYNILFKARFAWVRLKSEVVHIHRINVSIRSWLPLSSTNANDLSHAGCAEPAEIRRARFHRYRDRTIIALFVLRTLSWLENRA